MLRLNPGGDIGRDVGEVESDPVRRPDRNEVPDRGTHLQTQNVRPEFRGYSFVGTADDGVIELNGQRISPVLVTVPTPGRYKSTNGSTATGTKLTQRDRLVQVITHSGANAARHRR